MTERVTLITGASAGIGMELARIFAANGHRVVLAARRADRLNELAREITAAGGAAPIVIPCDLEKADACDAIEAALAAEGVEVEYLVNNAGFGMFGHAIKRDRNDQLGMIAVNIGALTDLTLRFADQLIRHRGGVLNLGSIAGFLPGPGMAVYYASKAYVLSFSEAIANELEGTGVTVTAFCPGPVDSGFQGVAKLEDSKLEGKMLMTSRAAAQAGYDAAMAGTVVHVPGLSNKLTALAPRFFPRVVMRRLVRRVQERRS